jgi:hypothetical protein
MQVVEILEDKRLLSEQVSRSLVLAQFIRAVASATQVVDLVWQAAAGWL